MSVQTRAQISANITYLVDAGHEKYQLCSFYDVSSDMHDPVPAYTKYRIYVHIHTRCCRHNMFYYYSHTATAYYSTNTYVQHDELVCVSCHIIR